MTVYKTTGRVEKVVFQRTRSFLRRKELLKARSELRPFEYDHEVKYWWKFPYRWNPRSALKENAIWNPNEPRIFPPKQFGVGWGMNLHAIVKKLRGG